VTGITIMRMNEAMDAGDVLLQRETPIAPDETAGTLGERLARLGADALADAIDGLHGGTLVATPQPAAGVTFAPRIEAEHCRIEWRRPAVEIERQVRALAPAPSAFTTLGGRRLKVHRAALAERAPAGAPGTIVAVEPDAIVVASGSGALRLLEVQLEGRRRLSAAEFLAGQRPGVGTCLGAA
jgi:methionyl-tRNA formyltransferase